MRANDTVREAGRLGRVSIADGGRIAHVDAAFCATMRAPADFLVGRNILDFTAPADRERCIFLIARLLEDGEPVATTKRLIRTDASHVWVHNQLMLEARHVGRVSIMIDESAPPEGWIDPAELLRIARLIYAERRARARIFTPTLFSDHAWDILLAAYISEARAAVLKTADLHAAIGISPVNASRWMRALNAAGLLEYEDDGKSSAIGSAFRLSGEGHRKFENFLTERYEMERAASLDVALVDR